MNALVRHSAWTPSRLESELAYMALGDSVILNTTSVNLDLDNRRTMEMENEISHAKQNVDVNMTKRGVRVSSRWQEVSDPHAGDDHTARSPAVGLGVRALQRLEKPRTFLRPSSMFPFVDDIMFQVLQFLTPKELSTACRVCSHWLATTLAVPFLDQRRMWWLGDSSTSLEMAPRFPTGPPLHDPPAVRIFGVPPIPCGQPLDLQLSLRTNLQRLGWQNPSVVQGPLVQALLAKRDVMTIAQHLSGKTSGCMIALVAILQQKENIGPRVQCGRKRVLRTQPAGLVVVPSRDAALQAHVYCRWLAQRSSIIIASCYSQAARGPQLTKLSQSIVDILVATPRRLRFLLQENIVTLDRVVFVLLDDLDELIDRSLEATEFLVQLLPRKRISCANSSQDITAVEHPKRTATLNFLSTSKFLHNEIIIFHDGFSPPPTPVLPRWTTVDEDYD